MMTESNLISHVEKVIQIEESTRSRFSSLYRADVNSHPIPFFGDINNAIYITVGVNPSATEFINRDWPISISPTDLTFRLINYFDCETPYHPWFDGWEESLSLLGVSYRKGVAHLDLSPRATVAMQSADPTFFLKMISEDIETFFNVLPFCRSARGLLMAGTVTKFKYAYQVLYEAAPRFGFNLKTIKPTTTGKARTAYLKLQSNKFNLPVFFCSVSPSAPQGPQLLCSRVKENLEWIQSWPLRSHS